MNFRVDLDIYRGPVDLLLYLVRKHEVEITDVPIALITEQFLAHLEVLQELDVNAVGDFLELASTLVEIKSRCVLPQGGEESDEYDDPREDLVQRLLEYKKYKDVASILEDRSRDWQQRYGRLAHDTAPKTPDLADQPIQEVELWDLVSAFGRIIRESEAVQPSSIVYDETPMHVYMEQIRDRLARQRRTAFSEMFEPQMHKSKMIGIFLAMLELVRHHSVRTEQQDAQGEIWILPGSQFTDSGEPVDGGEPSAAPRQAAG